MDNQRLFLYVGLIFLGLLIWQQWELDYGAGRRAAQPAAERTAPAPGADLPGTEVPAVPAEDLPDVPVQASERLPEPSGQADGGSEVLVVTDTLQVAIGLKGGGVNRVDLLTYPVSLDPPRQPYQLMTDRDGRFFVAQSGLQSADRPAPSHHDLFRAAQPEYRLEAGKDELVVPLTWEGEGVRVTKRFRFRRNSYVLVVEHEVENTGETPWSGRQYRQLQRRSIADDEQQRFIYTFIGGVILDEEQKYEKIDFEDFRELPRREVENSWIAIIEHYFLASWVPAAQQRNTIYTKELGANPTRYILGMYSPTQSAAPGATTTFSSRLYIGPKEQDRLRKVAEKLYLTVDYGVLTIIAEPLFWLLRKIHEFVGNWGWSIVVVTILIKLVFYKLSELSYRSMARMRKLQPKLKSLKERFGDDRQKLGQATMELYRKEKINPLGGCLPMIVQIPVFIALYWVLLESVELRQAPFVLWINDLSVRDPFFILPLVMGVTMFVQQKLNPTPVDPVQAKVFMLLPFVFTFFFAFFPAGLVLYWAVNNLLSILQQWYITRHVLAEK